MTQNNPSNPLPNPPGLNLAQELWSQVVVVAREDGVSIGHLLSEVEFEGFLNLDAAKYPDAKSLACSAITLAVGADGEWEPRAAPTVIRGVIAFMLDNDYHAPDPTAKAELSAMRKKRPDEAKLKDWFNRAFP